MDAQIKHYEDKLRFEMDSWDLFEALNLDNPPIVIDARSAEAYAIQHIPGALSLPHRTMDDKSTQNLDPSKLFVVYCDGIGCNASTKGALNMAKLGFQVKELMGGLDWWLRDGYATEGTQASEGKSQVCGC